MPKIREYNKNKLDEAIQDVLNKKESYRSAERKYGIPKSTIEFKIKHPEHKSTCGPSPILTKEEELILVRWITQMARKGFPRKANDLKSSVQKFLNDNPRKNPFNNNRPGDGWVKAFLRRHPEISERTSESVSSASACVSEKDIRGWFLELENYIKEKCLEDVISDPSRVYNGDESGFQINPSTGKVFAERGSKNVYTIDKGSSKENITVMFSFSASGDICVPMIVYPYMRFPEKISKSVNPEWGIGRSANGWMTSETFYEYIANVFHPHLIKNNVKFPVILFLDGHKSHLNYALSLLCNELQIEIFALYPNATRILQPCDVAVFRPLKEAWRYTVRQWDEEHPEEVLNKVTFAPLLEKAIKCSIKPETLVNGFRACGLCPLNPNAIDYSKCLGANSAKKGSEENHLLQNPVMDYTTFANIVGHEKICQFEILNQQIPDFCTDDFMALFKIWKHFRSENTTKNEINNKIQVQDEIINENEMHQEEIINENQINHILDQDEIINKNQMNQTDQEEINKTNRINTIDKDEIHYVSPGRSPSSSPGASINILSVDVLVHANKSQVFQTNENSTTNTISNTQEREPFSNKLRIINSQLFGQYLTTPESPKRKGKRNIERIPFAITSRKCQEMFEKKQQLKEKEEEEKEERKRKREQKLNLKKEADVKKKSQIKKNRQENKKCFLCKNIIERNNGIQCDTCKYFFHEHCIPKKHKQFIVDKEDPDEIFLCHLCYKEDNDSDASTEYENSLKPDDSELEVDELYDMYKDYVKQNK